MKIYPNEFLVNESSNERLKHIHSINERENRKSESEKTSWLISSRNADFVKTWANLANWSEKFFEMLKKGSAFRAEICFDPEADIAEINIYEKVTGEGAIDKNLESSGVEENP